MIRLALAGGFDERPPEGGRRSGQVIRFPIELRVARPADRRAPTEAADAAPAAAASSPPQTWPRVFPGL